MKLANYLTNCGNTHRCLNRSVRLKVSVKTQQTDIDNGSDIDQISCYINTRPCKLNKTLLVEQLKYWCICSYILDLHTQMEYLIGQMIGRQRRQRVHQPRTTYLSLSKEECHKLHLSCQAVTDICNLLADELDTNVCCSYAFAGAVKVSAVLHFFASGSFEHPLSSTGGISQSAVSSAIYTVTLSLVQHANEFIKVPMTPTSQERVKQEF